MAVRAAQNAEFEASAEGRHIRATMEADKDARGGSLLERHLASKSRKKADLQVLLVTTVIYIPSYNASPSISPLFTRYSLLASHNSLIFNLGSTGEGRTPAIRPREGRGARQSWRGRQRRETANAAGAGASRKVHVDHPKALLDWNIAVGRQST